MRTLPSSRWHLSIIVAAAAVLGLGACSSTPVEVTQGTSAPATSPVAASAGTAPGTTASRGTAPGTTRAPGSSLPRRTTTTDDVPGSTSTTPKSTTTTGPVNPTYAAWCTRFQEVIAEFNALGNSPEDVNAALPLLKQRFQELNDSAPEPIAADWATLNNAIQSINSIGDMNSSTQSAEFDAATDRIEKWSTQNCGFNPSDA